ncbi:uncharacterized protein FOMMEDRAFT_138047 [Fomitiporia mediterranea MF3/22]|uniref:uncharacterized protein n=1 Tax=Fomitiporia mediterranea (strain MF3/22) TaxID=694068 RepID=UPI0004407822|nr:uncharacterized protein FOMMEDRAFT_138047 [Fomitiporia mediterranea MF3/22]EJD07969.1 hypothetical protein FOMMEDRAFT_138047 [Fomitiporia mediterranea MF3/22]
MVHRKSQATGISFVIKITKTGHLQPNEGLFAAFLLVLSSPRAMIVTYTRCDRLSFSIFETSHGHPRILTLRHCCGASYFH